jgi:hypothetical protein
MSTDGGEALSPARTDAAARIAGYILLLAFFGLDATSNGLTITFRGTLTTSSPGELNFWLGHALLLCPAALLIGYGFGVKIDVLLEWIATRVRGLSPRRRRIGLLCLVLVLLAAARIGRRVFLLDLPVTDDELAVDFGGRILATGHVMTRLALPVESIPGLFLYVRDGAVGSFDWLGGQLVAAIADLTRLGPLVWAALAVTPIAAVAALVSRRMGAVWGLVAALIFGCSPMAALLSMTTHAQLASRAFFSLALLTFSSADLDGGLRQWVVTGFLIGLTFLCRPIETAFLAAPLAVWVVIQTWRAAGQYRPAVVGLALGFLPAVAIFAWHCYATTGHPLLPPRFAAQAVDVTNGSLWTRFGDNVSYNILMLAVWFLGPVGLVLIAPGVVADRFTRLLGASVVGDLCLALVHDNSGLHIVGPIHYSECAVPLTVIATVGLARVLHFVQDGFWRARIRGALVVALSLGLGTFTLVQAFALRSQAQVQRAIYRGVEGAVRDPAGSRAVVLAPWFFAVVNAVPVMRDVGTWVHDWRRPRLDLQDDILYLRDVPSVVPALKAAFPDRRFFRLEQLRESPFLVLVPLDGGAPRPLDTGL